MEYVLSFLSLYFLTYLLLTYLEEEWEEPSSVDMPFVTVLIPAYNESENIKGTIESALGIDYPAYEVIVIDDGSTDDTAEKAEKTGVLVLRQKNAGKADALNNGMSHAKGEIIATLDADSYVDPKALRYMVGFFKNPRVMAVTATMKVMEERGMLVRMQKAEYMINNLFVKIFSLLDSVIVTPGPFSLYRASVFKKLGGFEGRTLAEDNEMALRIQSRNYLIKSSKKAVVYTKVPKTLGALFRQRKRWYVGYIENLRRYRGLLSPRYGELGSFILPVATMLLILTLTKIMIDTMDTANNLFQGTAMEESYFMQPFQFLTIASLTVGLILFFISILESRENPSISMFLHLFLLMMLAPIMYTYAFLMRAYEIITRRSARW